MHFSIAAPLSLALTSVRQTGRYGGLWPADGRRVQFDLGRVRSAVYRYRPRFRHLV